MSPARKIDPFLLVVTDRDKGTFTIEGPITDDSCWNSAVVRAQEQGRNVRCFTPGPGTRQDVARRVVAELRLNESSSGSIVHPGLDD
jgi:hypothetical protein